MRKATETAAVRVETHGRVPNGSADLAAAKVSSLLLAAAEPILSARVMLAVAADPAVARPAVAQATIDLNGRVVRAQAAGQTVRAAIEQMASRLQGPARPRGAELGGAARRDAGGRARRMAAPEHPGPPAAVLPQARRPAEVIRRASYAAGAETPDEAVAELDLLDYDFHLFTERSTGQDSVIYRVPAATAWPWRTPSRAAWACCPTR